MLPRQPTPVAYATRVTDVPLSADRPAATWRTAAVAAWLVGLLVTVDAGAEWMVDQQLTLRQAMQAVQGPRSFLATGGVLQYAMNCGGAVAFPFAFGAAAAAVLYHWRRQRLAWVTAVPAAVGLWGLAVALTASTLTPAWLPAIAAAGLQCGLTFGGTCVGRPVARWLARRLLPPAMAVELIGLWI